MLYAKSVGKQLSALSASFQAMQASQAAQAARKDKTFRFGPAVALSDASAPPWSGDLSIQYLVALINDVGRLIDTHLSGLSDTHAAALASEGLGEGVLQVLAVTLKPPMLP
jgi:hypothetical protein